MTGVFGITLKHVTTKHAQAIRQALKIETGERKSLWHKYVGTAVFSYHTSYQASIGCEPSRVFHGRIPYNILDLKMGIRPQKIHSPDSEIAADVLEQTEMNFQEVLKNAMQAYIKYRAYYDEKPMPQTLNKLITFTSYHQKQITKEAKFFLQISCGLDLILLKSCYRTRYNWYAK